MSHASPPRTPQIFSPDDPLLSEEPVPTELAADRPPSVSEAPPADAGMARPTLADLGAQSWRWGALFVSAVAGATALTAIAWLMRLLDAALVRDDWLGWSTLTLLLVAAFAALMLILRELISFARLARLNRLRSEVEAALMNADAKRERQVAFRMVRLYRGRADAAWGVRRFGEHAGDVRDAGELLTLCLLYTSPSPRDS